MIGSLVVQHKILDTLSTYSHSIQVTFVSSLWNDMHATKYHNRYAFCLKTLFQLNILLAWESISLIFYVINIKWEYFYGHCYSDISKLFSWNCWQFIPDSFHISYCCWDHFHGIKYSSSLKSSLVCHLTNGSMSHFWQCHEDF